MNFGLGRRQSALEKVEVAAFVRLPDVTREHRAVAASVARRRRSPGRTAAREFVVGHLQGQAARGDVERDDVASAHRRERAADMRFGRNVQHQAP